MLFRSKELKLNYTEPQIEVPINNGVQIEDIVGNFAQSSTTPTFIPRKLVESIVLDTTNSTIYYYDNKNNIWRHTIIRNGINYYGNGRDGIVNLDGVNTYSFATLTGTTYSLTASIFATTFVLQPTITLKTEGYLIRCTTSFENKGTITHNGGNGGDAIYGNWGVGGVGAVSVEVGGGGAGGTGGISGTPAPDGVSEPSGLGGIGGNGGSAAVAAGAGGVPIPSFQAFTNGFSVETMLDRNVTTLSLYGGGSGGGGGGSASSGSSAAPGGGGAGGGGIIYIASNTITNSGTIQVKGGYGGQGYGGGGAGGGGAGGAVILINEINKYTNTGTIDMSGGSGGFSGGIGNLYQFNP